MEEKRGKPGVGGFKIRTFNYVMILVACVLYAFLLYLTVRVFSRYEAMTAATQDYINCQSAAAMVQQGSDILTEEVRLFAVTADLSHAEAYFEEANVTRNRDRGLEEVEKYHHDDTVHSYLATALDYSNELMEREIYAMSLLCQAEDYDPQVIPVELTGVALEPADLALPHDDKTAKVRDLVFGTDYQRAKALITDNISYSLNSTLSAIEGIQVESSQALNRAIREQRVCITLLFIMNVVVFCFITGLIVRPLRIYIKNIGDNKTLEIMGSYEFKYLALTYNNIYELNNANELMLRSQAERDALTGIMNRGSFDKLQNGLQTYPVPVTLVLIDVDKFKGINDTYGHAAGDQVLKRVARLLSESFRSTDFVARIGGDEFSVVITESAPGLEDIIRGKIDQINSTLRSGWDNLPVTSLSVGAASSSSGFDEGLFKRADKALYASKEGGRARITFYSELPEKQKQEV